MKDTGTGTIVSAGLQTINAGADGDRSYVELDNTDLPKAFGVITRALPPDTKDIIERAPLMLIRKDDGGTSLARVGMLVSGTEADNGSDIAVPTGYTPYQFGRVTNPHTGAAWSLTDEVEVFVRRLA